MKNKLGFLIISFFILSNSLLADDNDRIKMRPQDQFIFDAFIDNWLNTPDEIDLKFFNRGINVSLFFDYPLGYSNFGIAPGISFSSHNMYSDHYYKYSPEIEGYDFSKIDESLDYRNNKISLNYIDIPLEFRYRTRRTRDLPHTFRIAVGAKVGYLVQAHTKYSGDIYVDNGNNDTRSIKMKEHKLNNIEDWRYGIIARIGYGHFNITTYYPLTGVFKDNTGKDMQPFSIGLSFVIY